MDIKATESAPRRRWGNHLTAATIVTILAVLGTVAFHLTRSPDRLTIHLYYVGIAGVAYTLVKRRTFALTALVLAVASGSTLATIYFSAPADAAGPLLIARDLLAWSVLVFLCWRLSVEAFRFERREREAELERTIQQRTMELRTSALARTAHEVRTPLAAIQAIQETLLSQAAGPLNSQQKDFLVDLGNSSRYLINLIDDILDFAKAEAGMIRLARKPVRVADVIVQSVAMVEARARSESIQINSQVSPPDLTVDADPLRFRQILINLISNAVKFNSSGGHVDVQAVLVGDEVRIVVSDSGRGIAARHLARLFDPYYQTDPSDEECGTGLGLAIIRHLIELHGGTIGVDSVENSGSIFTVTMPSAGRLAIPVGDPADKSLMTESKSKTGGGPNESIRRTVNCQTIVLPDPVALPATDSVTCESPPSSRL